MNEAVILPRSWREQSRQRRQVLRAGLAWLASLTLCVGLMSGHPGVVQGANPTLTDPNLQVATVVSGLSQPTCLAFIGPNDFLINEKASGTRQAGHQRRGRGHGTRPAGERRLRTRAARDRPAPELPRESERLSLLD